MKKLNLLFAVLALAALIIAPSFLKNYGIHMFTTWLVFIIATMGLNLTVGYAGQKSLGHAAFFGIGAYTVAILMKAGFSFWLGLPVVASTTRRGRRSQSAAMGRSISCQGPSGGHWGWPRAPCTTAT